MFSPLPGSKIGSKGYMSARVQPNSPTDHIDDIVWQVFDAWSYGVGDLVLGTNPVSSETDAVAKIEAALFDLLATFQLEDTLPNCVLSHIDIQAEVEERSVFLTGCIRWRVRALSSPEADRQKHGYTAYLIANAL
ncbi:MAG: ethanolamine ammonia-lyase subunit EutB [Phaeodactylibacter sp.]